MPSPLSAVPVAAGRLPLVGHVGALWRRPLPFLTELRAAGPLVRVDLGTWPVYVLTAPDLVHDALTGQAAELARGRIYDRARSLFGNGLATSDGPVHRQQRRLVQPAFHHRRITDYAEMMWRTAEELADSWRPGQQIAVDHTMHELTLRTVVGALFSTELGKTAAAEIQRLMPVVMTGIAVRMVTPRRLDGWPIPVNRRFDRAASRLRQVVEQVIEAYRTQPHGDDLLSMLLDMTDEQACDEVISLLMAGTETPGNTLAWLFHEIARDPAVERRLQAEIDAVSPTAFTDLSKLTYTSQVINEVLRLHPVLLFTRRVTAPTVIADTDLPVGTELAFSPYALHRDPDLYPDPARFDPDRWVSAGRLFHPFGAGRHKCIGEAFAWTELHIVVAALVRRWRLRPVAGHVVREVVAEVPRPNALPMVVEPR